MDSAIGGSLKLLFFFLIKKFYTQKINSTLETKTFTYMLNIFRIKKTFSV